MNTQTKILVLLMLFFSNSSPINAADKKGTISLEQASEMVRLESKGKVLSARTTNFNGEKTHRIQVLTPSGRVKIFQIPLHVENLRNQHKPNHRYSRDQSNTRSNHSNHSNYRTPNSHTTSRNHSTNSNGDNKHK